MSDETIELPDKPPIFVHNDGRLEIMKGNLFRSLMPDQWFDSLDKIQELENKVWELERQLNGTQPDSWLKEARAKLNKRAEKADELSNKTGSDYFIGESNAFSYCLRILKEYAD